MKNVRCTMHFIQGTVFTHIIMVSSKVYTEKTVSGILSIFLLEDWAYQKCFEIREYIDAISDTVYSVYTLDDTIIICPSENIARNKTLIKLRLLSY